MKLGARPIVATNAASLRIGIFLRCKVSSLSEPAGGVLTTLPVSRPWLCVTWSLGYHHSRQVRCCRLVHIALKSAGSIRVANGAWITRVMRTNDAKMALEAMFLVGMRDWMA